MILIMTIVPISMPIVCVLLCLLYTSHYDYCAYCAYKCAHSMALIMPIEPIKPTAGWPRIVTPFGPGVADTAAGHRSDGRGRPSAWGPPMARPSFLGPPGKPCGFFYNYAGIIPYDFNRIHPISVRFL